MRIVKRCGKINCREFIEDVSQGFCEKHKGTTNKQYNEFRNTYDKEYVAFYSSKKWRGKRKQALRRDEYICQRCKEEFDLITIAEEVHHIVPTKVDWNKRLELDNLMSLCKPCHQQIESKR